MITTLMAQETIETSAIIRKQLQENAVIVRQLCQKIREFKPQFAVTIGRGSSDHACTYAKYLFETKLGLITSSAAPSTVTVYNADLSFESALVIGISQSGKSPDICKMMEVARRKGAITIAIVNAVDSPLAQTAEFVIPMWAGEERAVAATKSYIASLVTIAHIVTQLSDDDLLQKKLLQLPDVLQEAISLTWPEFIDNFKGINRTYVVGRGYGFPIAQEIALKFKETSAIQAEAFSAAELLHGPFALIKPEQPYLLLMQNDTTIAEILALALRIKNFGGKPMLILPENLNDNSGKKISTELLQEYASSFFMLPSSLDAIFDPVVIVQVVYLMIAQLAVVRGYNPDAPANLKKVTETL